MHLRSSSCAALSLPYARVAKGSLPSQAAMLAHVSCAFFKGQVPIHCWNAYAGDFAGQSCVEGLVLRGFADSKWHRGMASWDLLFLIPMTSPVLH